MHTLAKPLHPRAAEFQRLQLFANLTEFSELERRISALGDDKRKGDAFEVFAEAYFATQPVENAKHVWPSAATPPSLRKRLRLHSKDVGADGVIETLSGKFRGYQVKFRSGRERLTWTETATFFGVTDRCNERVLFTNCEDVSEVAEERNDFSSIRGTDLDRLESRDFAAIEDWLNGAQVVRQRRQPDHPHDFAQKEALQKIIPALRQYDRATVVRACGTGKTLLALWVAEAIAKRNVLVLVPSLALLRQTLREWANETNWPRFDYLCVCSDPTVSHGNDELMVRPMELEFSVTTEPREVRRFLTQRFDGIKIVFSTYQSAEVVAKGMPRSFGFDFGIFDEAHKTAGREGLQFSFALANKHLQIRKRLFLTATPKHYDLRFRSPEGEPLKVFSMDDEKVYGPVVHRLPFSKAAKRRIICNYKVVISVVTSQTLNRELFRRGTVLLKGQEIQAQQVANEIALAHAVRKQRVQKIFTFHGNVSSAKSFASEGSEGIRTHLKDFAAFHVNGTMPTAERDRVMGEFRTAPKALVTNARCLTEGIDVPAVDMVAFLSPKRSKVDIVQAAGRAMRRAPGKTTGFVLVPLFLNQSEGESIEEAIERAAFDDVWAVLQAMQEHDEVLDIVVHRILATRKLIKGFDDSRLRDQLEIISPSISLRRLRTAITTRCLNELGRPWETMVQWLLLFKKRFGHMQVPRDAAGKWAELGQWVDKVRALNRRGELSNDRTKQLSSVGFKWRLDGQTLDETTGLLSEAQFIEASGLSRIASYRRKGLIRPVGYGVTTAGLSPFYYPAQINELNRKLGVTLHDTTGLLSEDEFRKASGLGSLARYRRDGLIKPAGFVLTNSGLAAFYHRRQIKELKRELGITLNDTSGLQSEERFKISSGLSAIAKYRREGLIKPAGFAMCGPGVGAYYHPRQIGELRKRLGITLQDTTGLLSEAEFVEATGLRRVASCRRKGIIKPVGFALSHAGLTAFYRPNQTRELKKRLGITLDATKRLLNEKQFRKASGLTGLARYRKNGLIKPVGVGMSATHLSRFYDPRQVDELKKALGITLADTKGFISEEQFVKLSGLTKVRDYRRKGLIKPVGFAMSEVTVSAFYRPNQIGELTRKLGITLQNTKGLLNEDQFKKASGFTNVAEYRRKGLITPAGYAMAGPGVSAFYQPRQAAQLKKTLGITLDDTRGLLTEQQFRDASKLSKIAEYRSKGWIKPVGIGMSSGGVSTFYHPRQIRELKRKLGITLDDTEGLLNAEQFKRASGLSRIAKYRRDGLIKPVGYAMAGPRPGPFYHPRQARELRKVLGITLDDTDGLLNESQILKIPGLSAIVKYRKRGLIKPIGMGMSASKLSRFYDPKQIKALEDRLGVGG